MTKYSPQRLRIVIDSNVWISGLVFGGCCYKVIERFVRGDYLVVVSAELLSELRRKIVSKFPQFSMALELIEESILEDAELVKLGGFPVSLSRDPDDDKILETAAMGKCQYVISGDKDLVTLKMYQGIKIVTPREFLDEIVSRD